LDGAQWQMGVYRRGCHAVPGKEVKRETPSPH
jgi:hypothetical protein